MRIPDKPNISEVAVTNAKSQVGVFSNDHGLDKENNIVVYHMRRLVGDKYLSINVSFTRMHMRERRYVAMGLREARAQLRIAVTEERTKQALLCQNNATIT